MRKRLGWAVCLLVTASLAACAGERDLDGTPTNAGARSGTGGRGPAGQTGRGGADAIATGGTAPGTSTTPRPLPTGARNAVTSVSRFLWQSAPDASLLAMADSGAVVTTEDLRKLTLRMLIDARAQSGVGEFYRWWLNLDRVVDLVNGAEPKDPILFPQFNADLAMAMANETQTFGTYITLNGDGLFSTLLTAPFTFVNQALAGIYKVDGVTGTTLRQVALDPTERVGLFTQSGLLAMNAHGSSTSPTWRGMFWLDKLLCRPLPPPPPSVPPLPSPPDPSTTTRRRLEQHSANPACASCHRLVDPIGLAFEHFDAIGQFRATENGLPIDTSGQIQGVSGGTASFVDVPQLAAVLVRAPEAQTCFVQKWLEFAVGRSLTEQEMTAVPDAQRLFSGSGFNLRELIAAVTQTSLFLTHTPMCTPGADQTCNDSPAISSLRGHCTEGLRCVCMSTSFINPQTGRCY